MDDLKLFGIKVDHKMKLILEKYWPGKISIILPCKYKKFQYLHRGTGGLAFRLPANESLREILLQTGPLVAPSANPEGREPAVNLAEARKYFGNKIDFYYGSGKLQSPPSTLIKVVKGKVEVLREGTVKIIK
jgi:L-threonylcarbamoyladenylate synthase